MTYTVFGIIANSFASLKQGLVDRVRGIASGGFRWEGGSSSLKSETSYSWDDSDDEGQYYPFSTTDLSGNTVLVLSPHPDDESLTSGGSIALHVSSGDPVKVVVLTDGAKADNSGAYGFEEYVSLRQTEAKAAATTLGVSDLEFWNIPDRELARTTGVLERLCGLLNEYKPTLVYAPSPLEFHPDHRATANLIWGAVQRTALDCKIAFYDYNRPVNINTLVDISRVVELKRQAGNCYQSQLEVYPYVECAISFNHYRSLTVSGSCQYAEGFFIIDARDIWSKPIESFAVKQFLPIRGNIDAPLVSIVIRTRNRLALLRDAIASVLSQTYPNLEIVVVNDGGDRVNGVVEEFEKYATIKLVNHPAPAGRAAAANSGMNAASGKYINFLDDDDVLYSTHVEKLVRFLETTGEQFAYSDCGKRDYRLHENEWVAEEIEEPFFGVDYDMARLFENNYIPLMCAMFRRELFELCGPFDTALEWLEDWDLFLRMAKRVNFHRVPGVTAEYRRFSRSNYDNKFWTLKIYKKYRDNIAPELLAKHNLCVKGEQ